MTLMTAQAMWRQTGILLSWARLLKDAGFGVFVTVRRSGLCLPVFNLGFTLLGRYTVLEYFFLYCIDWLISREEAEAQVLGVRKVDHLSYSTLKEALKAYYQKQADGKIFYRMKKRW